MVMTLMPIRGLQFGDFNVNAVCSGSAWHSCFAMTVMNDVCVWVWGDGGDGSDGCDGYSEAISSTQRASYVGTLHSDQMHSLCPMHL